MFILNIINLILHAGTLIKQMFNFKQLVKIIVNIVVLFAMHASGIYYVKQY